jgi:TAG lipase/steryl ester hydrolase/phospholipase A2/LPA acyltransferase
MSLLRDPSAVHAKLHRTQEPPKQFSKVSVPSIPGLLGKRVTSFLRGSVSWAGDAFSTYWDGLSKEERERRIRLDARKQIAYLKMRTARSHNEWRRFACELDELEGNDAWKGTIESDEYNPHLVLERLKQLQEARASCDVGRLLHLIRTTLSRDLGGMSDARLYRHSHVGTKSLVDRYISTALDTISALIDLLGRKGCDPSEMQYILEQLLAARQAFGRSAMLFSGGATFGMNHVGVVKALWEAKLLPRIVSGASAGSIICAVFCVHTDEELPAVLESFPEGDLAVFEAEGEEETILQKAARFLKFGCFYDISHLEKAMKNWLGNITFQEAYNRTRRILNICISSAGLYELPRLLNYITAPNVLIWSAVTVSCSVPVVFSPPVLMAKDPLTGEAVPWHNDHHQWIDGSVDGDLPMTRLTEMFNVNHFIVSQVNPHVVPFLPQEESHGRETGRHSLLRFPWLHTLTSLAVEEALHRMNVLSELGIFPNELTKAASILSQKYSGDINIFPEILYTNFPRMLKNPTTEFMVQACLSGERATWPKLARIRNHVAIELALDAAVQTMRARVTLNPPRADLGLNTLASTSFGYVESNRGKGNILRKRRSSYSHELERPRVNKKSSSKRRSALQLRKTHSALSIDCLLANRLSMLGYGREHILNRRGAGDWLPCEDSHAISDSECEIHMSPRRRLRPPNAVNSACWGPVSPAPVPHLSSKQSPTRSQHPSLGKGISLPDRTLQVSMRGPPSPMKAVSATTHPALLKLTPMMNNITSEDRHQMTVH